MPYIKKTEKPCSHPKLPKLPKYWGGNEHMVGDIWECDDCAKRFITSHRQGREGDFRETWTVELLEWVSC